LGESGYLYSSTLTLSFLDGNYSFWSSFVPRNEIGYTLYSTPPYGGAAGEDSAYSSAQFQKLIANPNLGFSFLGWSSETGNSFAPHWTLHSTESALDENDELWANFAPQSNFLSLQYDEVKGTVSGFTEQVTYGDYLNLTASPKENYAFAGWELRKEVHFQITKDFSSVDPTFPRIFVSGQESPELNLIRGFTYYFDCNLVQKTVSFFQHRPTVKILLPTIFLELPGTLHQIKYSPFRFLLMLHPPSITTVQNIAILETSFGYPMFQIPACYPMEQTLSSTKELLNTLV
jgi:hypothetical protein